MSERARELADRLRALNDELLRDVEAASTAQWEAPADVDGETRTGGQLAWHVARGYFLVMSWICDVLMFGRLPQASVDFIHADNAREAAANPSPDRDLVARILRQRGEAMALLIGSLTDADLDRESENEMGNRRWRVEQLCGSASRHVSVHLAAFRSTRGDTPRA
ncbi:MAG TPA: hypothetical protein VE219_00540 [Candidatus Sulfotelmatobacter sp.]|nr:hypothetical protein [Candidatus Sulfotelmatobacter sp.]